MWQVLLYDGLWAGIVSLFRIALVLLPVMIVLEFARYYQVMDKIAARLSPLTKFISLPGEAAFPLAVGIIFGIVYGAAVIVDCARQGYLERRDLLLVGIFLSINHGMIEDTMMFVAMGANPLILLLFRLCLAVIVTRVAAHIIDWRAGAASSPKTLTEDGK